MKQSLVVRAPNWIGDVVCCLPAWERLSERYHLHIVGKGWLADLLCGYPNWSVYKLPRGLWKRRQLYLDIQRKVGKQQLSEITNAVVFPTSLGSVLEMKLAGLRILGHAHEGRGVLLKKSIPMPPPDASIYKRNWELSNVLLKQRLAPPQQIHFKIKPEVEAQTLELLKSHSLQSQSYITVCPFAVGQLAGKSKKWPYFSEWAHRMQALGYTVVCCPAASEEADWLAEYANIFALKGMSLAQYAAVLKHSKIVVANDTGPGHLAAAVGVPLISVYDVTNVETYGAIGSNVSVVKVDGWPDVETVLKHTLDRIQQ
ncbi:glycosyltransferase family 9 protein [Hydromonas duriensis]|uniref:Heptosyltransferase-2 n=1 Tax=Hydromonas duriensis TaxID=1527608 RepID=A0A4R6Y151_9BURK|nr:glycosyltransferase family 9 protein [Hydromonas duriensis]TDR29025.1 heptosyltransferase-2 [Hydromonas duriensis]